MAWAGIHVPCSAGVDDDMMIMMMVIVIIVI
jgi:hypothetical protein